MDMDLVLHQAGLTVFASMWVFVAAAAWRAARRGRQAMGGNLRAAPPHVLRHG